MAGEAGPVFLLQLGPAGAVAPSAVGHDALPLEGLIEQMPDGFVVADLDGTVQSANRAFLDLIQAGTKARC